MKKCELLAPAGGISQFVAAVENGADAIYLGGPDFNARMSAGNFNLIDMEKAVDYGHLRNVKTFVTMNTLLYNNELKDAVLYAKKLYEMGVDALIVQDLGLGKLLKESIPDFPLHLSTQATVYNRHGIEAAAELGYERVVLARELSLTEIKDCSVPHILDTEVFIHGALCLCYSGQCQLSRYIGGRSGNRGQCAQPCRLPYNGKYLLSTKDLSMIDNLGELIESGVSSLKVEGRMKSPEYVATVIRIYRKFIDKYYSYGSYSVEDQDRQDLMQIFNRGGFTDGYAHGDPGDRLMSEVIPKNQGIYIGKVSSTQTKENYMLADIDLKGPLDQGDIVEIRGHELRTSFNVSYFEKLKNGKVRIGDLKEKAYNGDRVYRIISAELQKKARESFADGINQNNKNGRKSPITFSLVGHKNSNLKLTAVDVVSGISVSSQDNDFTIEKAVNSPTTQDDVKKRLSRTGDTPFKVDNVKIVMDGDVYIPLGKINEIRRNVLVELEKAKILATKKMLPNILQSKQFEFTVKNKSEKWLELYFHQYSDFSIALYNKIIDELNSIGINKNDVRVLIPLLSLEKNNLEIVKLSETVGCRFIPYIQNVSKGYEDNFLENDINELTELIMKLGGEIYTGNVGWIKPLSAGGLKVYGDIGLNILNNQTEQAYSLLGMNYGVRSSEETPKGFGAFPLMTTEHKLEGDSLVDRKGVQYNLSYDAKTHKTRIYPSKPKVDLGFIKGIWDNSDEPVRIYITKDTSFVIA